MERSLSRVCGWVVLGDVCLVLLIFGFGVSLPAMKIPVEGHPVLTLFFGEHGILFGLVLPMLIYLLIPLAMLWAIAAVVGFLKEKE